jgi:hypothetical protein
MENKIMKNKIMVLMISAICATSIMQAEQTNSDEPRHRGWFEKTLEFPFEAAAAPVNQGQYSQKHQDEMKQHANNKKMKNKKSNKKSTSENSKSKSRKRSRPTEERS